jgi:outer membrane protein
MPQVTLKTTGRTGALSLLLLLGACNPPAHTPSIAAAPAPRFTAPYTKFDDGHSEPGQPAPLHARGGNSALASGNALVEPNKTYALADLVDLALRSNPATRHAWEQAKAAAAGLGIAEAAWLPVLTAKGYYQYAQQATGVFLFRGTTFQPVMELSWTLFDKNRPAKIDQASQQLLAANFAFNRTHQRVTYDVQRTFFAYKAAQAQVVAAEAAVRETAKNAESVTAQLEQGVATRPELLLAIQGKAKADYELQAARGKVSDAAADLAESIGVTPNIDIKTVDIAELPLPKEIEATADELIDRALAQRPDLSARLAELRAKEAEISKAEAAFWPTVSVGAKAGTTQFAYKYMAGPADLPSRIRDTYFDYGGGISFEWNLFDGLASTHSANQATAKREAAQAEFDALQLQIIKEVWKSYAEVKTALRKRAYALVLLKAAEQSFEALKESYANGLSTVIELLTAERSLASARYTEIESRSNLLNSVASLVYASGSSGDSPAGN